MSHLHIYQQGEDYVLPEEDPLVTALPTTYLKLDTSNDPLTDALHFTNDTEYIDQESW